jgi:TfoX/Sxy family transcriptional regulator of competence genes
MLRLTPQELTLDAAAPGELPRRTLAGVALTYGETATVSDGQKVRFEAGSLPLEGKKPKMYLYHDSARPVGVVTARELVGNSVMFEAKISDTTEGNEALVLASDGVLDAVSVGVVPVDFAYEADGTMVVKSAVWEELSLVPYGAFKSAVVEKVAATIPQTDDVLGNNEEQDPQEKDHEMNEPVETPAVIEAAAIAPVYAQPRNFKLPSPAEYIAAMVDGGSRWAIMNERIKAAAPDITTGDTPGILPEEIVGSPYDGLNPIRPFVSAIGVRAMPGAGSTFRRPKITVRPTVTEQPTGQLNTLDPSTVTVANFDITKKTFGTYVTMSEQDMDWSDPASLNIVLNQLAIAYGQATDNYAVDTMVSGVTQTETVTDLTDPEAVIEAIYGAAYQISNGSNYLPTHYFVSPVTWAKLGMLTTTTGAPVFPYVGAPNLIGQNALGTSSATSWNGNPLGLVLVVDKNMAGGTTTGTLSGVIGHAAGPAAGFEFYEQQKGAISVDVPSILGRTISWRGYAAAFMADATKFVKLVNA